MKKLGLLLLCVLFIGCETYYDYSTYYGTLEMRNCTDQQVSLSITPESRASNNEYKTCTRVRGAEIPANTLYEHTLSWVPGKFTMITIDNADDTDAVMGYDYKIVGEESGIIETGSISFTLISDDTAFFDVYETYLQDEYSEDEYTALKALFTQEEQYILNVLYSWRECGDKSYYFSPVLFDYDSVGTTKTVLKNFDKKILDNDNTVKLNFVCFS